MDYNINHVKVLLEKYWEGESSLSEEQTLRDYFQQDHIAPDLEQYKSLFYYFGTQQNISMAGSIEPDSLETKVPRIRSMKRIWWQVAAAAVLLIGLFTFYNNVNTTTNKAIVWEDTYDNEEEALQKAKEVLLMVSRKMKKGTDKAAFSLVKVQVATNVVKE